MSEKLNPLSYPEVAAHNVIMELIRTGKITSTQGVEAAFTALSDFYRSELRRIKEAHKAQ